MNNVESTPSQKDPKQQELNTILRPRLMKDPKKYIQTLFYSIGQQMSQRAAPMVGHWISWAFTFIRTSWTLTTVRTSWTFTSVRTSWTLQLIGLLGLLHLFGLLGLLQL